MSYGKAVIFLTEEFQMISTAVPPSRKDLNPTLPTTPSMWVGSQRREKGRQGAKGEGYHFTDLQKKSGKPDLSQVTQVNIKSGKSH